MKPGKEKRKKPRFIKAGDDVEMIENKISLFFDDSELFELNNLEKAKKLVAKVIKKKKLCTMFLDDKRSVPLIFKALAYNMEMNTKFYYAFYGNPDEEFLK